MLNLIFTGAIGLIMVMAFLIIIKNKPDFWFWLFLNFYFDPGGYVGGYLGGKLFGPLFMTDVLIVGIVVCLIFVQPRWDQIYSDKYLLKFMIALFIYSLYFYIVFGGVVPYFNNDFNYSTFLIKNRTFLYGLIILIAVYVFSLRDLKYFYLTTLFIGIICLSFYFITITTGLELIPLWKLQREGTEMTRISILSYGLFHLFFPLALIVYLLSKKVTLSIKYRALLYICGLLLVVTYLITLTRRTQIDIIGIILLTILIISYLFGTFKVSAVFKVLIPATIVLLIIYFTLPKYAEYITKTGEDTFLILTTGKNSLGKTEARVTGTGDLDIAKEYISNNLLFGTGWTYLQWYEKGYASSPRGNTYSRAADAAGEVPIYYLFFGFGVIGAILMLILYFMIGKLFIRLVKLLKLSFQYYLEDSITIVFSIYILLVIAVTLTVNLYQLSSDFLTPNLSYTAVVAGLGFALYRKIYLNFYSQYADF